GQYVGTAAGVIGHHYTHRPGRDPRRGQSTPACRGSHQTHHGCPKLTPRPQVVVCVTSPKITVSHAASFIQVRCYAKNYREDSRIKIILNMERAILNSDTWPALYLNAAKQKEQFAPLNRTFLFCTEGMRTFSRCANTRKPL